MQRGSLGADWADGHGVFFQRHRLELDGGYPSGQLHDQLLQRLPEHNQRVHSVPEPLIASGVTGTTYSNTGLAASTTYYYVLEALDADGTSPASTQASATTQASGTEIIAINFEGPAVSNSGGGDASFVADEYYSGGGAATPTKKTINLTGAGANAAPMAVYQTQRDGTFTYTIPGLTVGSHYTVLLHFAEIYFTAAGNVNSTWPSTATMLPNLTSLPLLEPTRLSSSGSRPPPTAAADRDRLQRRLRQPTLPRVLESGSDPAKVDPQSRPDLHGNTFDPAGSV